MSGRPGRSGGWNRLSPEEHALRGTKPRRFDAAFPLAKHGTVSPSLKERASRGWEPTADDLAGLGEAGQRFLRQTDAAVESTLVQGLLLVEAAHVVDGLATWRPLASTDKQAARLCVSLTKTLAALLAQIRVS